MTSFFFLSHECPVLFWVLISATVWPECVIIFVFLKESPGLKTDDGNMTACRHQLGAAPPLSDVLKCVFSCNGQCCSSGKQITLHTHAKWVYKEICWHRGLCSISVFLEERVSEKKMSQIRKYLPPQILRAKRSKSTGCQVCLVLKDSHAYTYMHFTSILIMQYAGSNIHACVRVSICMNVCLCIPPKGYGCSPTPTNADP